jgi:hypothetical protein
MDATFVMREPCKQCGCQTGITKTKNGQDVVYCNECDKYAGYNRPRGESGRAVRTVTTIHNGIKPKDRYRILERATGRCELCGKKDCNLHVGHLISVDVGFKQDMTEVELNSDENLCCMCDECNLGAGSTPIPLRLAVAMVLARLRNEKKL